MRAYERLLQYAKVYTTSDPESATHPSTGRQFDLARLLVEEMKGMGIEDAAVDEHCYVYGTIPATPGCEGRPALGLIAHMDTAPDAGGENVRPILHQNYDGKDVTLPGTGAVMKVEAFPFLASMKGETLITTDGTTLLGADDKAGIAEILTAAEAVITQGLPHGKLCIAFTPDEEIGEGASLFDLERFGADFAYTVDGGDVGGIEYENFNAASATVTVRGLSVHTGSAKDTMINASNVAMEFHLALPMMARPETTEGRQGFYHLCQMYGDVNQAKLGYILRDHDAARLEYKKDELLQIAAWLNGRYGPGTVTVELKDGYRNMLEKIKPHFHLVETARTAIHMAGLEPEEIPVRGGTDGAVLSWKGLPCPNLGTGGFNFHGVLECTTVERMDKATEVVLNIIGLYAQER
ncbi:MAG TPA: peptidase T [Candidatus Faecalibacterium avium]|nr:peptidase T [Candidatus Faecalibacterium avium]